VRTGINASVYTKGVIMCGEKLKWV